jgi:phosphoglycolate phosphatase
MTRNCRGAIEKVFPDANAYVDTIVTREDVKEVKPNPAHVEAVLARLRVLPSEVVVVGDHPTDILAGKHLSAFTAAVLSGNTTRTDFESVGPDAILDDIRGVPTLVASLSFPAIDDAKDRGRAKR